MTESKKIKRLLEIIPGGLAWGIIALLVALAIVQPVACAIIIIVFDFYWIIRTTYLTTLLLLAHRKLLAQKNKRWLKACERLPEKYGWQRVHHLVIFPVYKEDAGVLRASLNALRNTQYPKEKLIVVMAYEERYRPARETARAVESEFAGAFAGYLTTFHPDGLPGEKRLKGANATWAAKKAAAYLQDRKIEFADVVVSCFDADTCVDREYFGCLTYHFITNPKPHQASYQPVPLYNNNIWYAPSFARIVETSASFFQLIESMRLEKFVTFSSHSMSFKTLVDIDYWPVDMVSDDSVVYWKAFLFYRGDYHVIPLYTTVSMDIAYGRNLWQTILAQYRQKRRWAWGVENFPYVAGRFINNPSIGLFTKLRRSFHLLESHITWSLWAIIIVAIGPLPILLGGFVFNQMPIGYNLPRITSLLLNFTLVTSFICIVLARTILPPRPKDVSRVKHVLMVLEWLIVPAVIIIVGSAPALDAQTRLLFGRQLEFFPTAKSRRVV